MSQRKSWSHCYQEANLFNKEYEKTTTYEIALSGFRATGIQPFNRYIFSEHMLLPSVRTDKQTDEYIAIEEVQQPKCNSTRNDNQNDCRQFK